MSATKRISRSRHDRLSAEERADLLYALMAPRGRYGASRAAQLSGVPERTVYHWARRDVLQPDFHDHKPMTWSYRDLVFLRLLAFLRSHQVDLDAASALVWRLRGEFASGDADINTAHEVSAASGGYAMGPRMHVDELSGQTAFETMADHVGHFDLMAPLESGGARRHLWGPNLVHPSNKTEISPWVLSGEPVIESTRISTATLWALATQRRLRPVDIVKLYPDADVVSVRDAIELEHRLRATAA